MRLNKLLLVILIIIISSCKEEILKPVIKQTTSPILKGKVILENQTEHSNALVYIDGLDRGYSTDSCGNYVFNFTKADTVYNGEHKVYFFVYDYEMDSAKIFIEKGEIKLNYLDVDEKGYLKTKELKQMMLVEGWTNKTEYKKGDTLKLSMHFTNVSDKTVFLFIPSVGGTLNGLSLYYDYNNDVNMLGVVILPRDVEVYLKPGEKYEGQKIRILENNLFIPKEFYLVTTGFSFNNYLSEHPSKFKPIEKFIRSGWYKDHRGTKPVFDYCPNKFKFPMIRILR